MSNKQFLQESQHLFDSLKIVELKFSTLEEVVPIDTSKLSKHLQNFCKQTLVFYDPDPTIKIEKENEQQSIKDILHDNIYRLLSKQKVDYDYVQVFGYNLDNNQSLKLKLFNFGNAIFQNSLFSQLSAYTGLGFIKQIIYNYVVLVKYEGEYVQVLGKMLNEKISPSKKKKKNKKEEEQEKEKKWAFNYSNFKIDRVQIFYCNHMGRHSGIFNKNIFFEKGIKISDQLSEVNALVEESFRQIFKQNLRFQRQKLLFGRYLKIFITKFRKIFVRRPFKSNFTSEFDLLLALYCRLPKNYLQMKRKAAEYISDKNSEAGSVLQSLFADLYASNTSYDQVSKLMCKLIELTVPQQLLGKQNLRVLMQMMGEFISMKRFQSYKIQDFYRKMNVFKVPWIDLTYPCKDKKETLSRCKALLGSVIQFLFNKCLIQIIKYNFYVTEKHKEGNKIFYYRKPLWAIISKLAVHQFTKSNLKSLTKNEQSDVKGGNQVYPQGKLRILPKKGSFRPIITFNKKKKFQGEAYFKGTLNQMLADTQQVLRNLKNILATQFGHSVFDNRQIANKYDAFMQNWIKNGKPPLSYFTLDIKKCYDSIETSKLIQFIKKTPYIEDIYLIVKYHRIYRNKKPLKLKVQKNSQSVMENKESDQKNIKQSKVNKKKKFINKYKRKLRKCNLKKVNCTKRQNLNYPLPLRFYFNFKQRINAVSFKNDPFKISQDRNPSINIFTGKNKILTKQEIIKWLEMICSGCIISYEKYRWLQIVGIPQGLNVSGVLCSLYFASLQSTYVKVNHGILMRLTDDYLYIGPEHQAKQVLQSLFKCAEQNGFQFNAQKMSANFQHHLVKSVSNCNQIHWIGKRINIQTLRMFPAFQTNPQKLFYAMNVNLTSAKTINCFLKNKLKGLFTNHFSSYYKAQVYDINTLAQLMRLYTRITMLKFFPFFLGLKKYNFPDEDSRIMAILGMAIHQFVIYACFLSKKSSQHFYYFLTLQIYQQVYDIFFSKRHFHGMKNIIWRIKRKLSNFIQKQCITSQMIENLL